MRDYMMILDCTSPLDEPCAQLGDPDYPTKAREEAKRTIAMLERTNPPDGVWFTCKANPHDFGTYYTIEARFDDDDPEQTEYVYWLEGHAPLTWDEEMKPWKAQEEPNPLQLRVQAIQDAVKAVLARMNDSERFGIQFAMFPSWVEELRPEFMSVRDFAVALMDGNKAVTA